jgi:uncharacterized protein YjbJ (UPF0337 family)
MNRDRIGGIWMQFSGKAKERWGTLTADPLAVADGIRDQAIGRIQEQCALTKQESDRQLEDFLKRNRNWWNPARRRAP